MATLSGSILNISINPGYAGAVTPLQVAEINFEVAGTYVQADNAQLLAVGAAIAASFRDGRTVTLKQAMCGHPARKLSDPRFMMGLKTIVVSSDDITFEITEAATAGQVDLSTELAAGAVPDQQEPFTLLVSFTQS